MAVQVAARKPPPVTVHVKMSEVSLGLATTIAGGTPTMHETRIPRSSPLLAYRPYDWYDSVTGQMRSEDEVTPFLRDHIWDHIRGVDSGELRPTQLAPLSSSLSPPSSSLSPPTARCSAISCITGSVPAAPTLPLEEVGVLNDVHQLHLCFRRFVKVANTWYVVDGCPDLLFLLKGFPTLQQVNFASIMRHCPLMIELKSETAMAKDADVAAQVVLQMLGQRAATRGPVLAAATDGCTRIRVWTSSGAFITEHLSSSGGPLSLAEGFGLIAQLLPASIAAIRELHAALRAADVDDDGDDDYDDGDDDADYYDADADSSGSGAAGMTGGAGGGGAGGDGEGGEMRVGGTTGRGATVNGGGAAAPTASGMLTGSGGGELLPGMTVAARAADWSASASATSTGDVGRSSAVAADVKARRAPLSDARALTRASAVGRHAHDKATVDDRFRRMLKSLPPSLLRHAASGKENAV